MKLTPQDGWLRPEPESQSETMPTADEAARIRAEGVQNVITIPGVHGPFQDFKWAEFDGICAEIEKAGIFAEYNMWLPTRRLP